MSDITEVAPELSTQPAQPEEPARFGVVAWLRWAWRTLTSMRTALILLFLLAVAAVPGSLVPQRGLNELRVARFYQDHPHLAPVFNKLSLFDVFASWWFAAIYILLFTSLAGCVIPRSWQHARAMRSRPPARPGRPARPRPRTGSTGCRTPFAGRPRFPRMRRTTRSRHGCVASASA